MYKAIIALGSNLQEPINNLKNALKLLESNTHTKILTLSNVYKSQAYGLDEDNAKDFYNMVCEIETLLTPQELLQHCQSIENTMGRTRLSNKVSSRIIDLDIILYDNREIKTRELIIPHKEYLVRDFVLTPLSDIYSQYAEYTPKINSQLENIGPLEKC